MRIRLFAYCAIADRVRVSLALHRFVQEQIARVLLERLISNRPYPWGVIVTFSELIRSPLYAFSSAPFVHCAPEIERLFESVEAHIRSGAAGGAKGQAGTQQG